MLATSLLGRRCRKARGNNSRAYRIVVVVNTSETVLWVAIEDIETGSLDFLRLDQIRLDPQP